MRALTLAAVLVSATPAAADGFYFFESLGGSDVKDQLAAYIPSALQLRIGIGMRSGPWALETDFGAQIGVEPRAGERTPIEGECFDSCYDLTNYGLTVKYIQPLYGRHVEAYLKGGLRYGILEHGIDETGFKGRGAVGGAGIQLKGKVRALGFLAWPLFFFKVGPEVTASLFLDASYSFYRLHPGGDLDATPAIDAQITSFSGGFAIGTDF